MSLLPPLSLSLRLNPRGGHQTGIPVYLNVELENVQKRAARFVTRNNSYETGSMTGILEELKWETLQKRRKDNRLIFIINTVQRSKR